MSHQTGSPGRVCGLFNEDRNISSPPLWTASWLGRIYVFNTHEKRTDYEGRRTEMDCEAYLEQKLNRRIPIFKLLHLKYGLTIMILKYLAKIAKMENMFTDKGVVHAGKHVNVGILQRNKWCRKLWTIPCCAKPVRQGSVSPWHSITLLVSENKKPYGNNRNERNGYLASEDETWKMAFTGKVMIWCKQNAEYLWMRIHGDGSDKKISWRKIFYIL